MQAPRFTLAIYQTRFLQKKVDERKKSLVYRIVEYVILQRERVSSKYSFLSITHFFLFFPFAFFSCNALIFGKRKADLLGVSQCAVQSVSRATCPGRMFWMRCRNEIMLHRGREAMIILLVVMQAGSQ